MQIIGVFKETNYFLILRARMVSRTIFYAVREKSGLGSFGWLFLKLYDFFQKMSQNGLKMGFSESASKMILKRFFDQKVKSAFPPTNTWGPYFHFLVKKPFLRDF